MIVTFIGGPLDLQRHCLPHNERVHYAMEIPDVRWQKPAEFPEMAQVPVLKHVYDIREVDRNTFVGLHRKLR